MSIGQAIVVAIIVGYTMLFLFAASSLAMINMLLG